MFGNSQPILRWRVTYPRDVRGPEQSPTGQAVPGSHLQQRITTSRGKTMVRALFFAGGLFVALWGGSFLLVDEMVLTFKDEPKEEEQPKEEHRQNEEPMPELEAHAENKDQPQRRHQ